MTANNERMTNEEYQRKFKEKWNGKQECLSTYTFSNDKGKFKCLKCGTFRKTTFGAGLWNNNCMTCGKKRVIESITYSQVEAQEVLDSFQGNLFTIISGTGTDNDMQVKCNNCGFVHTGKLAVIKNWVFCPKCSMNRSYGELFIQRWFDFNNIKYTKEKAFDNPLTQSQQRMDYYLDDLNICIEIQGSSHFNKNSYQYRNDDWQADKDKKKYLEGVGITVLYCTGNQEDMVNGLCDQNDYFKQLKIPDLTYIKTHHAPMKEVIQFLGNDNGFSDTSIKYGIGTKLIKRYIKLSGYETLEDVLFYKRLKDGNMNTIEDFAQWLRFHGVGEAKKEFDIGNKVVASRVFKRYKVNGVSELRRKLLTRNDVLSYHSGHNLRQTAIHFHVSEDEIKMILK